MRLTFLGTRGNIDARSRQHRRHTSTLASYRGSDVMIDCGADWLGRVNQVRPSAIVLTHAHPDHVGGLRQGAPCAVYAPANVWRVIEKWPLHEPRRLSARRPTTIGGIIFEVFPVEHSLEAPAVGYRVTGGRATFFYVPDVLSIPDRDEALDAIALYVGDGASINRPIMRRRNGSAFGHASMKTQLEWCAEEHVAHAIFTHCGTRVVSGARDVEQQIAAMGLSRGIETRVAYDGLQLTIR
jgi:phosphoribosyl 1,2-cyclic phosphodiesterase